ncbi:MAG TPA: hypothetical protein VLI54_05965 [Bacillota bacterium]|nr:hypothetical protein [Bacillota bacterium]
MKVKSRNWSLHIRGTAFGFATVALLGCAFLPSSVSAGSAIAQSFQAAGPGIVSGAMVSLQAKSGNVVELTTVSNSRHILGVVGAGSLIELSNGSAIQVVTRGTTPMLVSDINGVVKAGDRIAASPIDGVGMKTTQSSTIVGSAQADFDVNAAQTRTLTDKNGKDRIVHIGSIGVLVAPGFFQAPAAPSIVPSAVQDFVSNLAGHTVSPVRVLVAGFLTMLLFVAIAMLLYSAVRSSIIAIGRNPLSEPAVRKSLFQVGLTTVGTLAFTIMIVYLILTV